MNIEKSKTLRIAMILLPAVLFWLQTGDAADKNTRIIQEFEDSMVEIPAGEFIMGTDRGQINERPAHTIYLDTYFISKYEIANRQYRAFLESTGNPLPFFWKNWRWNGDNYPVIGVSWEDTNRFCQWLSKITDQIWRLPTEAEWEKAASWVEEDKFKRKYPWGDRFERERVNIVGEEDGYERTAPIDSFKKGVSSYGIHHLAGNVSEWCLDWFENDYYYHSSSKNPTGPEKGVYKTVRGGEWGIDKQRAKNTFRKGDWPQMRYNYYGFRVVRVP